MDWRKERWRVGRTIRRLLQQLLSQKLIRTELWCQQHVKRGRGKGTQARALGILVCMLEGVVMERHMFFYETVNEYILHFESLIQWLWNHRYFSSSASSSIHSFDIYDTEIQNNHYFFHEIYGISLFKLKTSWDVTPQRILIGCPPKCSEPRMWSSIHSAELIIWRFFIPWKEHLQSLLAPLEFTIQWREQAFIRK
jgi:hypothetical protein